VGASDTFDVVILAIGFGLERDGAQSYWRNETIGQPSLDQPRHTYLVSGQGDGAMIDLLRLRVSQFRQDRILDEFFRDKNCLLGAIRNLQNTYAKKIPKPGLFNALEALAKNQSCSGEFNQVCKELARRLRRDTEAILHLRVRKLSELFDPGVTRTSFQNKLLVYFLYKCGGFFPSSLKEEDLLQQHSIPETRVIRRHGTLPDKQLKQTLSDALYGAIERRRRNAAHNPFSQSDQPLWSGGYFGYPGPSKDAASLDDRTREYWRKEYLPGATALLASTFCASLAGALRHAHRDPGRLRVTLHRTLPFGDEELLQQTCDYEGTTDARGSVSAAARTFPARNATIGLAYRCRRIVRSLRDVQPEKLKAAMDLLNLHAASRTMSGQVVFVLAIPVLQPEEMRQFIRPSPVSAVIYVDSEAGGFFVSDDELKRLVLMSQQFLDGLEKPPVTFDRIRNARLTGLGTKVPPAEGLPGNVQDVLELVRDVEPPRASEAFQLNFDYSDFVPVQG
jgi:hypothetical protein